MSQHTATHAHTSPPTQQTCKIKAALAAHVGKRKAVCRNRPQGALQKILRCFYLDSFRPTSKSIFERVKTKPSNAHLGQVKVGWGAGGTLQQATQLVISRRTFHCSGSLPTPAPRSPPAVFFNHQPFNLRTLVIIKPMFYWFLNKVAQGQLPAFKPY